jgi:hypothetical protein
MRSGGCIRGWAAALAAGVTLLVAAPAQAALTLVPAYTDSVTKPVSNPIYLTAPQGDSSRLFVVERAGKIRLALNGVMQDGPFLDISSRVETAGEGGLLSMAFAPDYASSGKFYVYFVEHPDGPDVQGDILIEEYTRSADPNVANTTPRPILQIQHDSASNHYGGTIAFGKDGVLYAAPGDGGTGGANAQDGTSQLGKLLAVDTGATPGASIVALGLRNPFRWSFDRQTGDIMIGDVGENSFEEIDWAQSGGFANLNFGWPCWEGNSSRSTGCMTGTLTAPVFTYGRSAGHSVTGGVVVRDPALTGLYGRYVYADHFTGDIRSLVLAQPATGDRSEGLPNVPRIVAFGEDADAHVYVVSLFNPGGSTYGGQVWRIVCEASCDAATGTSTGGGTPPPTPPAADLGAGPSDTAPALPAVVKDTSPPVLRVRAARLQRVLRRGLVRLSVACDERCVVRIAGRADGLGLRGVLKRLDPRAQATIDLRISQRVRRALARRGVVSLQLRARDGAGNLRTAALTVRVKRG